MKETSENMEGVSHSIAEIKDLSDSINININSQEATSKIVQEHVANLVELNSSVLSENKSQPVSEADVEKLGEFLHHKILKFKMLEDHWDTSMRSKNKEGADNSSEELKINVSASQSNNKTAGEVELF
jgi:hypothetical protein